jgi:uncharacterized protein YgbK (DUF1537 family)
MLRLAYYADDFTGATDALEILAQAGLRTRLFLDPPTAAQCTGLDAIGVAGLTRSLAPDPMEHVLHPAFTALHALAPRHVHYKVCSTFDSSPTVGSIGRAIDVGAAIFASPSVPLLVAAPALGRYCVFGQLFARYGIGSNGAIHRLDRHPAVSRHPVTPMTEADLRLHLGRQTAKKIGLLDVLALDSADPAARFAEQVAQGAQIVLIDGLHAAHLHRAGQLIDGLAVSAPLFSVGSTGIESALIAHWGFAATAVQTRPAAAASPLLALSGSCSPVTAGQIDQAAHHGFTCLEFSPAALPATLAALRAGRHTLLYTNRGSPSGPPLPADRLGAQLGQFALEAIAQSGVRRLAIAGGDTSSYAARALGIHSLEFLAPLSPGAPLCRAQAPGSPADGLEVVFKGGQVGAGDFFLTAAH